MTQNSGRKSEQSPGEPQAQAFLFCNNDTLRKATRNLGQIYDNGIQASNLRSSQFGVIVHIDVLNEPTMKELAAALVMDLSSLSRALQPLIRDGFVRLVPNAGDGRSKRVTLSKAGQRKLDETRKLWTKTQARFEKVFGAKRAQALRETMMLLSSEEFTRSFGGHTRR